MRAELARPSLVAATAQALAEADVRWADFAVACPELAAVAAARFAADELVMIGTVRRDGSPRISPVEPELAAGELLLGMMWRSHKALDLLRDARLTVHTITRDRRGTEGDLKLYGRAADVADRAVRRAYEDALEARIGWRPTGDYHCFAVDVESAGYVQFGEREQMTRTWTPVRGLVESVVTPPG